MFEWSSVVLGLLGVFGLLYLWVSRHYSYWTRRGLVQPPSTIPFVGNLLDNLLGRRGIPMILDEIYRSYPNNDAVGVYSLLTPKLFIRSPRLIQKVLVTDFSSFHDNEFYVLKSLDPRLAEDPFCVRGEEWRPCRAKLSQTLTPAKIKEIFPLMKETTGRLDSYLHEHVGKDLDAKELSTLFMMDNVSNCVFGINSNCFSDPEAAFRKMADLLMKDSIQSWTTVFIGDLLPKFRDLIGIRLIPKSVNNFVEKLVQDVLEHRTKNDIKRNDLFQVFMKKSMESKDTLNEMCFYGMTFFLEGFETSSMAAGYVLYELAMNPSVQETLYEELKRTFGERFDPDLDTIYNSLPYLDKIIQESQRKYPLSFAAKRLCTKACTMEVDGKNLEVDAGTTVIVPMFSVQRDPKFYPDPDKFDPDRFSEEGKATRPPYTFLAFGEGPRICPGMKFAMCQVKLLISDIVYHYEVGKTGKTPEKLTFDQSSFFMVPAEIGWIRLERRKNEHFPQTLS